MYRIICFLLLFSGVICFNAFAQSGQPFENVFFPFHNSLRLNNAPSELAEIAKALNGMGYDGMENHDEHGVKELLEAFDPYQLKIPALYIRVNIDPDKPHYDPQLKKTIRILDSRNSILWMHIHSEKYKAGDPEGEQACIEIMRELADFAHPYGVRLATYPHTNFFVETVGHSVELVKKVNRRNFGAVFNLCHLLKVEGSEGIKEKIEMAMPYLFAISISGADAGNTQQYGWDRLIQPLDSGTFEVYPVVKMFMDLGYRGPVGLQCYNIKGDYTDVLSRSMREWKKYKKRYISE